MRTMRARQPNRRIQRGSSAGGGCVEMSSPDLDRCHVKENKRRRSCLDEVLA